MRRGFVRPFPSRARACPSLPRPGEGRPSRANPSGPAHCSPVFLNLWAGHRPTCLAEGPEIGQVYARYRNRVQFVAVDARDNPKMARFRVREWGWTFPAVIDYYADVARAYRVRYQPTSFFIA